MAQSPPKAPPPCSCSPISVPLQSSQQLCKLPVLSASSLTLTEICHSRPTCHCTLLSNNLHTADLLSRLILCTLLRACGGVKHPSLPFYAVTSALHTLHVFFPSHCCTACPLLCGSALLFLPLSIQGLRLSPEKAPLLWLHSRTRSHGLERHFCDGSQFKHHPKSLS